MIIEGTVEAVPIGVDPEREDAHAATTGFDPRTLSAEYVYLRITPRTIQAWREANELAGRLLMKDGAGWTSPGVLRRAPWASSFDAGPRSC